MQSEQTKTFQPQNEALETRERVKLEGRDAEEEQPGSQTSTLQSLGDVGEHTPKSTEILQKVFHKTTDAIATSVDAIKNLVLVDQTKLEQEDFNLKQKAQEIKGKVTEKFGAEVQPEKDLDKEVKEHIKEINEEIRDQPHGEEEVFEGHGQAKPGKKDEQDLADKDLRFAPKEVLNKALEKIEEMRDQSHEGHEHHQLTTESPSFRPTEETHQLIEAVKEGFEEHVPLTEKVQELESHKQESPQNEGNVQESVKEGLKEVTEKINGKVQDVKEGVEQKKEETPVEQRKPIIDQVVDKIHSINDSMHKSVQDVKDAFKVEERTDDRKPIVDVVSGTIYNVSSKIHDIGDKISHGFETFKGGISNIPQTLSVKLGPGKEKAKEEGSE